MFLALAGCASSGTKLSKEKIDEKLQIPTEFQFTGYGEQYQGKWWEVFDNEELNSLIEEMMLNNNDIAGSYEGIKSLQAALGITSADRLPTLDAGASAGEKYSTSTSGERKWRDSYDISLTASYEIDVWGRIKAGVESDRMALLSGKYDLETLYMTLTAEFADRYFIYKSLANVLKMQREMLALRQKQVSALEMMYSSGVGSLDTIYVKQTAIANLMESMTETRQSMQEAKLQMALLMGITDASKVKISDDYNLKIPYLPLVIPADITKKRPDVKSAYASVLQVDRDVAQAAANRYPKLSFSASVAYSGDEISNLVSPENFLANLLANLTVPLFDAGKLKNQQKKQEYLLKKEVFSYYQTVLDAINEVSVSLADNMQNEQALQLSQHKVGIEEKRLKVAEMKYEMGIKDYSDVIDNKISLLSGWITEVNSRRALISSRVELARASGGTWTEGIVETRLSDSQETK